MAELSVALMELCRHTEIEWGASVLSAVQPAV